MENYYILLQTGEIDLFTPIGLWKVFYTDKGFDKLY